MINAVSFPITHKSAFSSFLQSLTILAFIPFLRVDQDQDLLEMDLGLAYYCFNCRVNTFMYSVNQTAATW